MTKMNDDTLMLDIHDLHAKVEDKDILKGITLSIRWVP
jgi:Fe-S cluster assembly ATPase SufC